MIMLDRNGTQLYVGDRVMIVCGDYPPLAVHRSRFFTVTGSIPMPPLGRVNGLCRVALKVNEVIWALLSEAVELPVVATLARRLKLDRQKRR